MARSSGGAKDAHSAAVRCRALGLASSRGVEAAARATGVKPGTIRSWIRRRAQKLEREQASDGVIARLKAEGMRMLAKQEERRAAEQLDVQAAVDPASESPAGSNERCAADTVSGPDGGGGLAASPSG
jgi:uncharacterized protein (DUF2252 family)